MADHVLLSLSINVPERQSAQASMSPPSFITPVTSLANKDLAQMHAVALGASLFRLHCPQGIK
jgi:hypothetical protein